MTMTWYDTVAKRSGRAAVPVELSRMSTPRSLRAPKTMSRMHPSSCLAANIWGPPRWYLELVKKDPFTSNELPLYLSNVFVTTFRFSISTTCSSWLYSSPWHCWPLPAPFLALDCWDSPGCTWSDQPPTDKLKLDVSSLIPSLGCFCHCAVFGVCIHHSIFYSSVTALHQPFIFSKNMLPLPWDWSVSSSCFIFSKEYFGGLSSPVDF